MDNSVINHIYTRQIDSYQKLRLLLLLYEKPGLTGTSHQFAEWLYLGNTPELTAMLVDLQSTGLLDQIGGCYTLRNEPEVRAWLNSLAKTFENPLSRQSLLTHLQYSVMPIPRTTGEQPNGQRRGLKQPLSLSITLGLSWACFL